MRSWKKWGLADCGQIIEQCLIYWSCVNITNRHNFCTI
jgi:hypothetical protein